MKNKIERVSLAVMTIIFLIGLILILSSVSIGRSVALDILMQEGGMDTSEYQIIMNSAIESFRTCGLVMSFLGGLGNLLIGYILYNKTDKQS